MNTVDFLYKNEIIAQKFFIFILKKYNNTFWFRIIKNLKYYITQVCNN